MRDNSRILSLPMDGRPMDFRLTKLDAFSGVFLLRLLAKLPGENVSAEALLSCLPDADLRSLMTVCLEHTEVLLPAGWLPVMTRGEWSYPELAHDTAVCLKLCIEEVLWTLEGFFGERAPSPPGGAPAS